MSQEKYRELDRISDVEETLRRRTAQLEALRQVGLELAAELDLDALLGSIVSHAVELLDGETGGLYLYRPEQDVLEWSIGAGPRLPPIGSTLRPGEGLSGKVWETGQSMIVGDYHHWPGRAEKFDHYPNAAALGALISWGEERLGAINILFDLSRTLTDVEVEILELFATQAAIAIRNARLYEEAQRRADRLAVVNHVARAVGATLHLDRLLEVVYKELNPIFVPDAFFIALYDEDTQELEYRFQVDEGMRQPPDRQPVKAGLSSLVISKKGPLIVRDLEEERPRLPTPLVWGTMKVSASWLGVPMLIGERLIGIISVQAYRAHAYGSEEEMLLSTIADQVAVAIERAQLVQDLEQSLEDLRLTQDRLVQAQKMEAIGRLAGGVAHDFNNLLTAILGYSDLVLHEMDEDSPLCADVQEISKGAERAAALTQQLLAFSRKQMLRPRVFDLNDLARGVENMLRRLIGEHVELEIVLGSAPAKIEADPSQIEQILVNLVVNARDAMLRGGRIRVETAIELLDQEAVISHPDLAPGRHVCLVVSDNGTGMDDEILAHIFEPFFTTKELGKGTGLGLATVHGIVKQSGGDITVHSNPGEGTVFTVYLPYADADTYNAAHWAKQNLPRGSEIALLVEDEDMVRELAQRTLEKQGYEVLSASHPDDALRLVETYPGTIDLLITDVVMPGMGGRELAERLALVQPDTKVLYISGYTDDAIVHKGVLDPGVAFLQKPFTPLILTRKVRQILDDGRHGST